MALRDLFRKTQSGGVPASASTKEISTDRVNLHAGSCFFAIPAHTAHLLYTSDDAPHLDDFRLGVTTTLNASTGVVSSEEKHPIAERSTVFTGLPVSQPKDVSLVEKLPYRPAYVWLSEEQRWVYLDWLQNIQGDVQPEYIFLYFYGLERRMLTKDFEQAFHEVMMLRQYHDRDSFPGSAERSVLALCIMRNRADCANEYLTRFPCSYLDNLSLLVMSKLGMGLTPEQLINSGHLCGDRAKNIKRTYLNSHPTLYRTCLDEVLRVKFGRADMPFADILGMVDIPTIQQGLFTSISMYELVKSPEIPNIVQCKPFQDRILSVLAETHEAVKERLASLRKSEKASGPVPALVEPGIDSPTTTCPACGAHFTHTPASGRKCPSCGIVLRLRTDPKTRVRSLMTAERAVVCHASWREYRERIFVEGMANSADIKYADVYKAREGLSRSSGIEAHYSDILVPWYRPKMTKEAEDMSWGLWRNDYYSISELYRFEGRFEKQLEALLAVCYIDANGPNNTQPSMQSLFPAFTPPKSLINYATAILDTLKHLVTQLAMDEDTEKSLFLKSAETVRNRYMPLAPEVAWNMVLEAQTDYEGDSTGS